jgi:menaquinone-9 beta-reductase
MCFPVLCVGEGIHTAMMGGKAAAQTVLAMRATGDFSKRSCKQYERKCVDWLG